MLHSRTTSESSGRPHGLENWVRYLHTIAQPTIASVDPASDLERALGRPYSFDAPVMLHAMRETGRKNDFIVPRMILDAPSKHPDLYLWWGLTDPSLDPLRVINCDKAGSLIAQETCTTIEVWTETELAALHALANHAARRSDEQLAARIRRAIAWHIDNTQPDNATAHPWGVHAFLLFDSAESLHFAETLVSNCLVQNARPDPLSAWILIDAANVLEKR